MLPQLWDFTFSFVERVKILFGARFYMKIEDNEPTVGVVRFAPPEVFLRGLPDKRDKMPEEFEF